jgi:hypothetical protein
LPGFPFLRYLAVGADHRFPLGNNYVEGLKMHSHSSTFQKALRGLIAAGLPLAVFGQTNVLTYKNNNARTGANTTETVLTHGNVNSTHFGKLWFLPSDGWVDAQPLYVSNLVLPGHGTHNTLFVETENDTVYALDAITGAILWQVSLLLSGETPSDNRGCDQITPEMGITSTPAIYLKSATAGGYMYVVAMSKDSSGNYHQRLHALSLGSGAEVLGGPVNIQATYPSTGPNSSGGVITFNPGAYKSRPAVLLLNGMVYLSFSSNCDDPPFNGWIMVYSGSTLAQETVLNVTPNGQDGALWGSGGGPAADASGNIYQMVGNGTFDQTLTAQGFPSSGDYGNGFLKLKFAGSSLSVSDYFASYNAADGPFDENVELGSSSPLVLPDMKDATGAVRHLAVGAGKVGTIFVVDLDNMGKYNPAGDTNVYQALVGVLGPGGGQDAVGAVRFPPAFLRNLVYFSGNQTPIKAFEFTNALLSTAAVSSTPEVFQYPGAGMSTSANVNNNGILWAAAPGGDGVANGLYAYVASNLSQELYNSNQAPNGRDQITYAKFAPPTVANGMVYVATQTGVAAFGLLQ